MDLNITGGKPIEKAVCDGPPPAEIHINSKLDNEKRNMAKTASNSN